MDSCDFQFAANELVDSPGKKDDEFVNPIKRKSKILGTFVFQFHSLTDGSKLSVSRPPSSPGSETSAGVRIIRRPFL